MIESNETAFSMDDKGQLAGLKRLYGERPNDQSSIKSMNFCYNSLQNGIAGSQPPLWSIPPLLPSISCSYGGLSSKLPFVAPSYNATGTFDNNTNNKNSMKSGSQNVKFDECGGLIETQNADLKMESSYVVEAAQQEKPGCLNPNPGMADAVGVELGFGGPMREAESTLN